MLKIKCIYYLLTKVKMNLYKSKTNLFPQCPDQESFLDSHQDQLIKLIALKYLDIRLFHEIRKINDQNIKFGCSRTKLTKMILFQHE